MARTKRSKATETKVEEPTVEPEQVSDSNDTSDVHETTSEPAGSDVSSGYFGKSCKGEMIKHFKQFSDELPIMKNVFAQLARSQGDEYMESDFINAVTTFHSAFFALKYQCDRFGFQPTTVPQQLARRTEASVGKKAAAVQHPIRPLTDEMRCVVNRFKSVIEEDDPSSLDQEDSVIRLAFQQSSKYSAEDDRYVTGMELQKVMTQLMKTDYFAALRAAIESGETLDTESEFESALNTIYSDLTVEKDGEMVTKQFDHTAYQSVPRFHGHFEGRK